MRRPAALRRALIGVISAAVGWLWLTPPTAEAGFAVTRLPGFDGPLPFSLETGYVEVDQVNGVKLFYYFVKSERKPEEDPLILWLPGGPGCSAVSALAFGIGPVEFEIWSYKAGLPALKYREDNWNKIANIIYLDSPVGAGFSYSETIKGYKTSDSIAATQVVIFLNKWIEEHSDYKFNPLFIGGDSHAGMIVPNVCLMIAQGNAECAGPHFNLKGYLLGNPLTDYIVDGDSRIPQAYGLGLLSTELFELAALHCGKSYATGAVLNAECALQIKSITRVLKYINPYNVLEPYYPTDCRRSDVIDPDVHQPAIMLAGHDSLLKTRLDGYVLCNAWGNDSAVREALGTHEGTVDEWRRCNCDGIDYTLDLTTTVGSHADLTSRKSFKALIFSGDHDMLVPPRGTLSWIRSLDSSVIDDWRPWWVDGNIAGYTMAYSNGLTFATVKGAGHISPEYNPRECLAMFKRWIEGNPL